MRRIPIKFFQLNMYAYWKEMPFILTRRGKPFAVVRPYKKVVSETPRDNERSTGVVVLTCKHGYPRDKCQKCKKK